MKSNFLKIKDYNTEKISLTKKDKLYFVSYDGKVSPKIKLPEIEILDQYIIPSENNKFFSSDTQRSFLKLQIENQDIINFFKKFGEKVNELIAKPNYQFFDSLSTNNDQTYLKLKLNVRDDVLETNLFLNNKLVDGDIEDFRNFLRKDAIIKMIIYPAKVWVMQVNRSFGIQYKVSAIKLITQAPPLQIIEKIFDEDESDED